MREFEPTLPKGSIQLPENTTTLVIEDVPSDVAWKFITGGGKDLGTEEQKEQLIRMFEGSTKDNKEQLEEKDEHSLVIFFRKTSVRKHPHMEKNCI